MYSTFDNMEKVVDKRRSPDYEQVSAYLPKPLARQFKTATTAIGVERSVAMEEAITLWLSQVGDPHDKFKFGEE